jgi:hypothetical protein
MAQSEPFPILNRNLMVTKEHLSIFNHDDAT